MSIRARICLCIFLIIAIGFSYMLTWLTDDIRPRLLGSVEDSLVDTSRVLAAIVGQEARDGMIDSASLRRAVDESCGAPVAASIHDFLKTSVDLRVYVTDAAGIVVFDSDGGRDEGKDYSRWNDVYLTLRGKYGARATRSDPADPYSSTMVVAAPVMGDGKIIGVLSVCKPTSNPNRFVEDAKSRTLFIGAAAGLALILIAVATTLWITRPLRRLTHYAQAVRDGQRARLPELGKSEIGMMGRAMEEMRSTLEGKEYIERYVQTLTHEIKGPVAAIQGAAELLQEEMPAERRARFVSNIAAESARIEGLVDRLLLLASVEGRRGPRDTESLDLPGLLEEVVEDLAPLLAKKSLVVEVRAAGHAPLIGERFLVRQALANVLLNAVEFTPDGGRILAEQTAEDRLARVVVTDTGPGIPDFALTRVFERFYSLSRPDTGKKGSGLGLCFAREVALLHGGAASVENGRERGARVTLTFRLENR